MQFLIFILGAALYLFHFCIYYAQHKNCFIYVFILFKLSNPKIFDTFSFCSKQIHHTTSLSWLWHVLWHVHLLSHSERISERTRMTEQEHGLAGALVVVHEYNAIITTYPLLTTEYAWFYLCLVMILYKCTFSTLV